MMSWHCTYKPDNMVITIEKNSNHFRFCGNKRLTTSNAIILFIMYVKRKFIEKWFKFQARGRTGHSDNLASWFEYNKWTQIGLQRKIKFRWICIILFDEKLDDKRMMKKIKFKRGNLRNFVIKSNLRLQVQGPIVWFLLVTLKFYVRTGTNNFWVALLFPFYILFSKSFSMWVTTMSNNFWATFIFLHKLRKSECVNSTSVMSVEQSCIFTTQNINCQCGRFEYIR